MKILVTPFVLLIILLIKLYQKTFSVWIDMFVGQKCKYYPSCSHYAVDALKIHNFAALPLIAWRLLRCNPFSHGGVDYVSPKYFENYSKNPQIKAEIGAN